MAITDIQMQAIQDAKDIDTGVDTSTKEERVREQMDAIKSIGKGALFSPVTGAADIVDMGAALPDTKPGTEFMSPVYSALEETFDQLSKAGINRENVVKKIKEQTGVELKGDAPELIGEIIGLPAVAATNVATSLFKAVGKSTDEIKSLFRTASGGDDLDGMAPAVAGDARLSNTIKQPESYLVDTSITKSDDASDGSGILDFGAAKKDQEIKGALGDIQTGMSKIMEESKEAFDILAKRGDTDKLIPGQKILSMGNRLGERKPLTVEGYSVTNQPDWAIKRYKETHKDLIDKGIVPAEPTTIKHKGKNYRLMVHLKDADGKVEKHFADMVTHNPTLFTQLKAVDSVPTSAVKESNPRYMKNEGGLMLQKGGAVPMKEQMSMFEDGGLMDEGGSIDPVSGNDVPPGSTQEEVRDDIPAQLSEGEFVFPADVVRFIGLNNLMQMRQQAKMGLKQMEEMGQMGNSEEATMPDDLPFDINDLDIKDDDEYNTFQEFAVGGMPTPNPNTGVFYNPAPTAPTTGVAAVPTQAASQQFVQPMRPQQAAVPTAPVYTPAEVPTFKGFVGENVPGVDFEYVEYTNEAGNVIKLRKSKTTGELLDPVPEGYTFVDPEATKTEEVTTTPTTVETATVSDDDNEPPVSREELEIQRARVAAAKKLGITDQVGFSIAGAFGNYRPEDVGKFTSTGFIIGKNGVLLDPLTGTARDDSGPTNIVGAIISALSKNEEPPEPAYSDSFFDNMPDTATDALGRSLGKDARDARLETAAQRRQSFEDRLRERKTMNRAATTAQIARERQDEIRQTRNDISTVQAQARAEIASQDNRQQAAERAQREARERQEDRNEGGSGQTVQEKADSYTADRVSEAVSTGDFSRGFAEGGLASKPKPKTKKKMKKGGLASKK